MAYEAKFVIYYNHWFSKKTFYKAPYRILMLWNERETWLPTRYLHFTPTPILHTCIYIHNGCFSKKKWSQWCKACVSLMSQLLHCASIYLQEFPNSFSSYRDCDTYNTVTTNRQEKNYLLRLPRYFIDLMQYMVV